MQIQTQQKIALVLNELKRQIDTCIDNEKKATSAKGWANLYNERLRELASSLQEPLKSKIMHEFESIVPIAFMPYNTMTPTEYLEFNVSIANKVSIEIYRLLCEIDPVFFDTEKKKREAELNRAEADRRKAVADFKEQGQRIEETDKARGKNHSREKEPILDYELSRHGINNFINQQQKIGYSKLEILIAIGNKGNGVLSIQKILVESKEKEYPIAVSSSDMLEKKPIRSFVLHEGEWKHLTLECQGNPFQKDFLDADILVYLTGTEQPKRIPIKLYTSTTYLA
jgi:hypothetical protein